MIDFASNEEGFGYTDVQDIEKKEYQWIIDNFFPTGFGVITGLPKAGNSTHGGKSVLSRLVALAIVTKFPLFGEYDVKISGSVLMVNLDEEQTAIKESIDSLAGGIADRGIKISNAHNMNLPEDFDRLEADIKRLRPKVIFIDPLLRLVGGRDISGNTAMGEIINGLKKFQRKYDLTVVLVHHSPKRLASNKSSASSEKLLGSVDMDSAWDFLFYIKYYKSKDANILECDYKYKPSKELYFRSIKEGDKIVGLELLESKNDENREKRIVKELSKSSLTVKELVDKTSISESAIKRNLKKLFEDEKVVSSKSKNNALLWSLN